jgi:hypothetical protein
MSRREVVLDCPFCHSENHLYYNIEKRVFFCFKCNTGGTKAQLVSGGGSPPNEQRARHILLDQNMVKVSRQMQEPPASHPMTDAETEYLVSRGVRPTQMHLFQAAAKGIVCMFPDEDYWQMRAWSAFAPPRWVNPTDAPRQPADGLVYHLRPFYDSRRVVLVEGIFDAIPVSKFANVAAMLSKNYHEKQLQNLKDHGYSTATLMFDRDVSTDIRITMIGRCASYFSKVAVFDYNEADPGEASPQTLAELLEERYAL